MMNLPDPPSPLAQSTLSSAGCPDSQIDRKELAADDFLPPLGAWSHRLGFKSLLLGSSCLLALSVWPWRITVRAAGVVRPSGENTIVQSQMDGVLSAVWIKPNQIVQKGQPIASLDRKRLEDERRSLEIDLRESLQQETDHTTQILELRRQLQSAVLIANAQLGAVNSDVDSARSKFRFNEAELARYRLLQRSGAIPLSVLDEKVAMLDVARNELAKARQAFREQLSRAPAETARLRLAISQTIAQNRDATKALAETRARLADVRRALQNSVIQAPLSGTVLVSSLRNRQQVIRAGEILAEIAPSSAQQLVKVRVPSRDVGSIKLGQRAFLKVSACPYPEFGVLPAQAVAISADTLTQDSAGNRSSSLPGYEVSLKPAAHRLLAHGRPCELRQGMDVQAEIVTRRTTLMSFLLAKLRLATDS